MNIQEKNNTYIVEGKSAKKINVNNSIPIQLSPGLIATIIRLSHGAKGKQANIRVARLIFDASKFTKEEVSDYVKNHSFTYYDVDLNGDKLIGETDNIVAISDHEVIAVTKNGTPKDQTLFMRIQKSNQTQTEQTMTGMQAEKGEFYKTYTDSLAEDHDVASAIGAFNARSIVEMPQDEDLVVAYFDVLKKCLHQKGKYNELVSEWENGPRLFRLFEDYAKNHFIGQYLLAYRDLDESVCDKINAIVSFIDSLIGNYGEVSLAVTYGSQQELVEDHYSDEEIDHLYHLAHMTAALAAMYEHDGGAIVCLSVQKEKDKYYGFAAKDGQLVTISPNNLKLALSQMADGSDNDTSNDEYLEAPIILDASVISE